MERKILTADEALLRISPKAGDSGMRKAGALRSSSQYELVQTIEKGGKPRIYVFSDGEKSIITSSEGDFPAILGIVDGVYAQKNNEDNGLDLIMDQQIDGVEWYQEVGYDMPSAYKIHKVQSNPPAETKRAVQVVEEVSPLLMGISHGWGQRVGYTSGMQPDNSFYPISLYNTTTKENDCVPCGCITLALSQVLAYWGSLGYYCGCRRTYGYTSSVSSDHIYEVPALPDVYRFNYEDLLKSPYSGKRIAAAAAAARLQMFNQISRTIYSQFEPDSTGSMIDAAVFALKSDLAFAKQCEQIQVVSAQRIDIIREELEAGRPVIMAGTSSAGISHCFVCDGYKSSMEWEGQTVTGNFFHICTGSATVLRSNGSYTRLGKDSSGQNAPITSAEDVYNDINWYVLTDGLGTLYKYASSNLRAIIGIDPVIQEEELRDALKGDVNNDGYINMTDVTVIINHILGRGGAGVIPDSEIKLSLSSEYTYMTDSAGVQITGRTGKSIFLPYGGQMLSANTFNLRMHIGYYWSDYVKNGDNVGALWRLKHEQNGKRGKEEDYYTYSSGYGNVRLIYIGNTPEEDGAVDIGMYVEGNPNSGESSRPVLWASKNLGASRPGEIGDFFSSRKNVIARLQRDGLTSKWRLPTYAEMSDLISNLRATYPKYDLTGDSAVDMKDVNWIIDFYMGRLVRLFYSSLYRSNEISLSNSTMSGSITLSTNDLKDYISPNTYYGGYYETMFSSKIPEFTAEGSTYPPLEPYSVENAATSSKNVIGMKQYYLHEVPKSATVPIILGSDFMAVPWEGPLSRAYLGEIPTEQANIVADYLGETVDSFTITKNGETETITNENGNYILFPSGITKSQITSNGITIETLDGVQVLLEFGEDDFDTQYQTWALNS